LLALPPEKKAKLMLHNFTVFILNRNSGVTDMIEFTKKPLPESIEAFWEIAGLLPLEMNVEQAHVSVKMKKGWEKLGPQERDTSKYVVDEDYGAMFQLSPSRTPDSSPTIVRKSGNKGGKRNFASVWQSYFRRISTVLSS
jgi:hypothetical protein